MSAYQAPLRDMLFNMKEIADIDAVAKLPGYEEATENLETILEGAAEFATGVLDPLNKTGDVEGAHFDNGQVTLPKGFKAAFKQFAADGWIGLPMPTQYGGMGLPMTLSTGVLEMWQSATWRSRTVRSSTRARSKRFCSAARTSRSSATFPSSSAASGRARWISPSRKPARIWPRSRRRRFRRATTI
jgi:hypothetical protein